ncbi:MAG: cysteine--tRNA ligase [Rhodobacteraceae bacterium]|nr:cysteine--tRNA ligase [Paracoccaceae bacterium]
MSGMKEPVFFNTASRRREPFRPIDPRNVRIYACGPTVYDRAHIGNARPAVVFDLLFRLLRFIHGSGNVTYARNITDIDDKINARAASLRQDGDERSLVEIIRSITDQTIRWYREDMRSLNVLRPTFEPRATEFVPAMISMIEALVAQGHAYSAGRHVLFNTSSFAGYGRLANRSLDEMQAGARVEVAPYKRNTTDFVLWKPSSDELPGWDSPWGRGRPGWHIECSAMCRELLGESFDIHGGGIDLVFPHHENELAQSRCACPGGGFAKLWMHNGFVQVEGEKMAKSLGNFVTVRDLLDRGIDGGVIRFVLLSAHYRQPLDWTTRKAEEARRILRRWRKLAADDGGQPAPAVLQALADDLNTPKAISELHRLANSGEAAQLKASAEFLGLPMHMPGETQAVPGDQLVEELMRARDDARKRKDFSEADRIRDRLAGAGVEISDGPHGTVWSKTSQYEPAGLAEPGSKGG